MQKKKKGSAWKLFETTNMQNMPQKKGQQIHAKWNLFTQQQRTIKNTGNEIHIYVDIVFSHSSSRSFSNICV